VKYPSYDLLRDRGAWTERVDVYDQHEEELHVDEAKQVMKVKEPYFWGGVVEVPLKDVKTDPRTQQVFIETKEGRQNIGVKRGEQVALGFSTPSRKMEFYARWFKDWGWAEYAIPIYPRTPAQREAMVHVVSHVHHQYMTEPNAFALNPIFRLPYNIHTRSVNSKWLMEISQNHNPLWINTKDAERLGFKRGQPVKVRVVDTMSKLEAGYFVAMAMPTEGVAPGTLACLAPRRPLARREVGGHRRDSRRPLGIMGLGAPVAAISEQGTRRNLTPIEGVSKMHVTPLEGVR
jgi:anaerobic selenocysteine-containing dehydrogenase